MENRVKERSEYESKLKNAGADYILNSINDINEIYKVIKLKQVSAIMIEVIQGEGGINISENFADR